MPNTSRRYWKGRERIRTTRLDVLGAPRSPETNDPQDRHDGITTDSGRLPPDGVDQVAGGESGGVVKDVARVRGSDESQPGYSWMIAVVWALVIAGGSPVPFPGNHYRSPLTWTPATELSRREQVLKPSRPPGLVPGKDVPAEPSSVL